jgi:adenine-specific DNA methylase
MRLRLPWRDNHGKSEAAPLSDDGEGLREATQAEERARGEVESARSRGREATRIVARLRELQQVNHISERVAKALQDGYLKHPEGGHGR